MECAGDRLCDRGIGDNFTAEQQRQIFDCWRKAGADLGNHTWTHPDLNKTPIEQYEGEIARNDAFLHKLLDPIKVRYFRAPYLHEGDNETTKAELGRFLADHYYSDAPVTFDDDDYLFASVYNQSLDAHDETKAKLVEEAYIPYMRSIVEFWE
jgi:peptidoglycan/xylan/chitin deacetylase (PgdA/CDA1 family)